MAKDDWAIGVRPTFSCKNNLRYVQQSKSLQDGARGLADRTIDMAKLLVQGALGEVALVPGGRKGNQLDVRAQT